MEEMNLILVYFYVFDLLLFPIFTYFSQVGGKRLQEYYHCILLIVRGDTKGWRKGLGSPPLNSFFFQE